MWEILGGLGSIAGTCIAITLLLDKWSRSEHKAAIAGLITTDNASSRASDINAAAARIFRPDQRRAFLTRAPLFSLLFGLFIVSLQSVFQNDDFKDATLPFLRHLVNLDVRAWLILVSFVTIDVISIRQTLIFFRFLRYCNNVIEYIFVISADIMMSMALIIVLLPAFISASIYLSASGRSNTLDMLLTTKALPSGFDISYVRSLVAFSPPEDTGEADERIDILREAGWHVESFAAAIAPPLRNPDLGDLYDKASESGAVILLRKALLKTEDLASAISELVMRSGRVASIRYLDQYTDNMGNDFIYLRLTGISESDPSSVFLSYLYIMRDVNFFDTDLSSLVSLRSRTISENDLYYYEMVRRNAGGFFDESKESIIYCDGDVSILSGGVLSDISTFQKCAEGLALTSQAVEAVVGPINYTFKGELAVPILPLALTSLVATVLLYYIAFAYMLAGMARRFVEYLVGPNFVKAYTFSIVFMYVYVVIVPVGVMLWVLIRNLKGM